MLIGSSFQKYLSNIRATITLLEQLGLIVNYRKSDLVPRMEIEYLGLMFNSSKMIITLPQRKCDKIMCLVRKCQKTHSQTIETVASLIGNLIAASPAGRYSMIQTRYLELDKTAALGLSNGNYSST